MKYLRHLFLHSQTVGELKLNEWLKVDAESDEGFKIEFTFGKHEEEYKILFFGLVEKRDKRKPYLYPLDEEFFDEYNNELEKYNLNVNKIVDMGEKTLSLGEVQAALDNAFNPTYVKAMLKTDNYEVIYGEGQLRSTNLNTWKVYDENYFLSITKDNVWKCDMNLFLNTNDLLDRLSRSGMNKREKDFLNHLDKHVDEITTLLVRGK